MMSKTVSDRRDMILNGDIFKSLLILSMPTILMAFVQSLIPLIDGYFLNNYGGVLVAGAVSFSQPVINILMGLSQGLGVASMAIIGQYNGRAEIKKVKHFSLQILIFSFGMGILTTPLSILIAFLLSKNVDPQVAPYIYNYLATYSFVMPLLFLAAIFNGIKNATGQPEATFIRMIILLILKIIFNFIYLEILALGVKGAALASLSSYVIIGIWMFYDLFIKESETKLNLKSYKFDYIAIREVIKIGIPSMFASTFVFFGFFLINMEVQSYGAKVLNASGIASNINSLAFTVPSSISTTVTTMVSMNIGIGESKKAKSIMYKALIASLIIGVIIVMIFWPTAPKLVKLFQKNNPDQEIMKIATHALNIYTFSVFPFAIYMIIQGTYIGLGRTKAPLFMGVLRIWLFRFLFILAFKKSLGVNAVFWGNLFSNSLAAIVFFIAIQFVSWQSTILKEN
ncbi:MATE family efflux transporter [Peptoniphilus mikwangii]|uniref:MATE family efflux transporter n=1 Tax=Peptoniphilus mikwangii TaxID=1354300 RepID=UPI000564FD05|nr:MATE family efflux transporter [Peptoniphilus mikwangii]